MPESVVVVTLEKGWVAHVRYEDRLLDQDIASSSRYTLNYRIDQLFLPEMRRWP